MERPFHTQPVLPLLRSHIYRILSDDDLAKMLAEKPGFGFRCRRYEINKYKEIADIGVLYVQDREEVKVDELLDIMAGRLERRPQNAEEGVGTDEARITNAHLDFFNELSKSTPKPETPKPFKRYPSKDLDTLATAALSIAYKNQVPDIQSEPKKFEKENRRKALLAWASANKISLENYYDEWGKTLINNNSNTQEEINIFYNDLREALEYQEYDGGVNFRWPDDYKDKYQPSEDGFNTHPDNFGFNRSQNYLLKLVR